MARINIFNSKLIDYTFVSIFKWFNLIKTASPVLLPTISPVSCVAVFGSRLRNLVFLFPVEIFFNQRNDQVFSLKMFLHHQLLSFILIHLKTGADSGGGAPSAPPPQKKEKKKERERGGEERGSKEETIRSIRGKTSAEAFVISF